MNEILTLQYYAFAQFEDYRIQLKIKIPKFFLQIKYDKFKILHMNMQSYISQISKPLQNIKFIFFLLIIKTIISAWFIFFSYINKVP